LSNEVKKGCSGTIVFLYYEPEGYEVEFFDEYNETIDVITVQPDDIEVDISWYSSKLTQP
jgi:hypothetical protein